MIKAVLHYNSRILELSTKCEPKETFQATAEARSFLLRKGIDLEGDQKTKTKTALQYFSKHLGSPALSVRRE